MDSLPASQSKIAKEAGVSRATVSRVFTNHPGISEVTKKKVREVAKKLGYRKNAVMSVLTAQVRAASTKRIRSTLAYITSMSSPDLMEIGPTYYEQFLGARERADELGYGLDLIWRHEVGMTKTRITKILLSRGIRGLVLAVRPTAMSQISLDWSNFAVSAIGHALPSPKVHYAAASHYFNMGTALRKLQGYGYMRIGYAIWPESDRYSSHSYVSRFYLYQHTIPTAQQIPFFFDPIGRDLPERKKFEHWVKRHRPDVILGVGPTVEIWLRELGLNIPEKISHIDLCLPDESGHSAGIFELPRVVGAMAVELVIEQLNQNVLGIPKHPKMLHFEGKWIDAQNLPRRSSIPPP